MYEQFATFSDQLTVAGMDRVIAAGSTWALAFVRSMMLVLVAVSAVLMWFGDLKMSWVVKRVVIALFVILLLRVGEYGTYIRTPFWETIPNGIASSLTGGTVAITPAQRFDKLSDAAAAAVARVDTQVTGMFQIRAQISLAIAQGGINIFIGLCFALWLASRVAIALLIGVGPYIIIAAIFDVSRSFVIQWFGKLISLSVWSLCAMALTEMVLQGSLMWIRTVANANAGAAEAVDGIWKIAVWMFICGITMLGLPYYTAIGGSASGGMGVAGGLAGAGMKAAGGAALSAAGAAAKMGRAAGTAAAKAINKARKP